MDIASIRPLKLSAPGGLAIAAREAGPADGPVVVLLPGWPQTAYAWRHVQPLLSAAGYRSLALDLPGMGGSDLLPDGVAYDTGHVSDLLAAAVAAAGIERYVLVGHDVGTWTAYAWATRHPTGVERLCLTEAAVPGVTPDAAFGLATAARVFQFYFNAVEGLPEILTQGRERAFLDWFFQSKSRVEGAIAEADLDVYAESYSRPGRMDWIEATTAVQGTPAAPVAHADDLALIQFTSGSTREPKGVELTHANLVANLEMLRTAFEVDADSRFASWLPLFHDMGLAMLLMPLYFGVPGVLMPPLAFIRRPSRWLQMVHDHRATITGAPNFAFELCLERGLREDEEGLDLSCCRVAFCGAEPVRRSTMRGFAQRYGAQGLATSALFPCYGLAEAVCFVSGGRLTARAEAQIEGEAPVACGPPASGSKLSIVDPKTLRRLDAGEAGEVWVAGPHVGRGYRGLPQESSAVFGGRLDEGSGPCLRTGDLGYLDAEERLVLVGRMKDVLIHRGVNIHAGDLEALVAASHGGFGSIGAAFAVLHGGAEAIVVVQEAARGGGIADHHVMRAAALDAVAAAHGVRLHDLILVRPGALPKTTSGKVRRDAARDLYLDGRLGDLFRTEGRAT